MKQGLESVVKDYVSNFESNQDSSMSQELIKFIDEFIQSQLDAQRDQLLSAEEQGEEILDQLRQLLSVLKLQRMSELKSSSSQIAPNGGELVNLQFNLETGEVKFISQVGWNTTVYEDSKPEQAAVAVEEQDLPSEQGEKELLSSPSDELVDQRDFAFLVAYVFIVFTVLILLVVYASIKYDDYQHQAKLQAKMKVLKASKGQEGNLSQLPKKGNSVEKESKGGSSQAKAGESFLFEQEENLMEVLSGRVDSFMESQIDEMNFRKQVEREQGRETKQQLGSKNKMSIVSQGERAKELQFGARNLDDFLEQPKF
mmetsp:Transcript_4768/g.8164  ORF Transcript_4768/g.8164 Transcript_4768/m.8164 type:complete len:313 (-) Transcript_4768:23-961(-)